MEILAPELARAERERRPVAVVLADLDQFKRINNSYGYLGGDEVLREASRRLRITVRPYDIVGRYSGAQYLIVMPGCDQVIAKNWAERMREQIAATPVNYQGQAISITASLGVAAYTPKYPVELYALLQHADAALCRAKSGGRTRVEGIDAVESTQSVDT